MIAFREYKTSKTIYINPYLILYYHETIDARSDTFNGTHVVFAISNASSPTFLTLQDRAKEITFAIQSYMKAHKGAYR